MIPTLNFEAKVRAANHRTNQSGDWIALTLQVHPDDFKPELREWAKTQQRVMVAAAAIGDDEQPVEPRRHERTRSQWAGIRCNDGEFQRWIGTHHKYGISVMDIPADDYTARARTRLLRALGIQSRKELDTDPNKQAAWDALDTEFKQATGRMAERTT